MLTLYFLRIAESWLLPLILSSFDSTCYDLQFCLPEIRPSRIYPAAFGHLSARHVIFLWRGQAFVTVIKAGLRIIAFPPEPSSDSSKSRSELRPLLQISKLVSQIHCYGCCARPQLFAQSQLYQSLPSFSLSIIE